MPAIPVNEMSRRRDRILELVAERGHVVIAELATELAVSEMTIRRDVAQLDQDERLVSFFGGVRSTQFDAYPGAFGVRAQDQSGVKNRIAQKAIEFIAEDSVIALDAGSTVALLAQKLVRRKNLRVVSASVPAITILAEADGVELLGLGGTLRRGSQSFTGPSVVAAVRELQIDTFFLGAAGLSERGAFDVTDLDAVGKRELIGVSSQVVAMADAEKFGRRAMSRIGEWSSIDVLITDDRITDDMRQTLVEAGVKVICVPSH